MAINEALPGVEVDITVDDEPLHEHIEAGFKEESKTVTRYVQAKSDQKFAVRIKLAKGTRMKGHCLVFEIYVDGKLAHDPLVDWYNVRDRSHTRIVRGHYLSPSIVQPFRFESLEQVSDGKIFQGEVDLAPSLGTIEIVASHRYQFQASDRSNNAISGVGIVSEKALKGRALSHGVAFDNATIGNKQTRYETRLVRENEPVAAKMVFKYRSYESLQVEMIIPRPPPPQPLEEKDHLTLEEIRELQRQNRELKV